MSVRHTFVRASTGLHSGSGHDVRRHAARHGAALARRPKRPYRVSVTGFSVKSPTWDHALEVDGKGDEVYVAARVTQFHPDGSPVLAGDRLSETMGDTKGQNGRIQAGTAPCCWPTFTTTFGGLRAGDSFPTSTPWVLDPQPSPDRNYPPMTLWEGELSAGGDAVVIAPSLWEWDGGKDAYGDWIRWGQATAKKLGARIGELFGPQAKTIVDATSLGLDVAVSMSELLGTASDLPIGMQKRDGKAVYDPKVFHAHARDGRTGVQAQPERPRRRRLRDPAHRRPNVSGRLCPLRQNREARRHINSRAGHTSRLGPRHRADHAQGSAANFARGIPVTVRCTTACRGTVSMKLAVEY